MVFMTPSLPNRGEGRRRAGHEYLVDEPRAVVRAIRPEIDGGGRAVRPSNLDVARRGHVDMHASFQRDIRERRAVAWRQGKRRCQGAGH